MNRWLIIAATAVLAGCARYHAHPLSPAQTAASLEARRLDDPAFRHFAETNLSRSFVEWPPKVWDFDLLVLAALYYHPSLDVARAQWAVALGGNKIAAARPNPAINIAPGLNNNHINAAPGLTPWFASVTFDVPVETAGKRRYRMAEARQLSESARLNIAATAWQVRSNLRVSLLELVAARQRQALLRNQLDVQDQIVHSLEQRLKAGAISSAELGTVRIARERTRLDWLDAERVQSEALVSLSEAIGVPARALEGVEISSNLALSPPADGLLAAEARQQALLGRPDILSTLAQYAASESALQLEIARQYPDLHFNPGYQYDQGDNKWALGVTFELPVLNQNQGPIAQAEALRKQAAATFIALQAKVIADIDRAVASYEATARQLGTLESLTAQQRKQTDAVEAQVKAGAADPLDLLSARLELAVSEVARHDGEVKLQQALGALEDAVQRPVTFMRPSLTEQSQRADARKENVP